jgi:hypothetical protein
MKIFLLSILFSMAVQATAQQALFDSVNRKRYDIAQSGFVVLGSWAALSIGAGLVGQGNATGERKQFYKATVIGGLVDLAFAGVGYFSSRKMAAEPHTVAETFRRQTLAEKLFLFSVGLDLGAITFGFYTKERANRFSGEKKDWLRGAGNALILQGIFLTVFDGVLYVLQTKNGTRLHKALQNLRFGGTEGGVGLSYRF